MIYFWKQIVFKKKDYVYTIIYVNIIWINKYNIKCYDCEDIIEIDFWLFSFIIIIFLTNIFEFMKIDGHIS